MRGKGLKAEWKTIFKQSVVFHPLWKCSFNFHCATFTNYPAVRLFQSKLVALLWIQASDFSCNFKPIGWLENRGVYGCFAICCYRIPLFPFLCCIAASWHAQCLVCLQSVGSTSAYTAFYLLMQTTLSRPARVLLSRKAVWLSVEFCVLLHVLQCVRIILHSLCVS